MYRYRLISALEMKSSGCRTNASIKPNSTFYVTVIINRLIADRRITEFRVAKITFPTFSPVSIRVNEL